MNLFRRPTLHAATLLLGAVVMLQGCLAQPEDLGTDEAVNPSHSDRLEMSACGTVLGSFDGTEAYSNGADTSTGNSCDGYGTYGLQYQCVELVMRHFKKHWGLSWSGNAKDLLNNAPKNDVSVYQNGDGAHPPVPGDMIVWTKGTWGHVALVTAVHAKSIEILEQNVKGNGKATLDWDGATIGVRWTSWVPAGWAHAKASSGGTGGGGAGGGGGGGAGGSGAGGSGAGGSGAGGSGTGGNPGVSWDCGKSDYNGQQYWTCSGDAMYKCVGGVAQEQACSEGCQSNAVGTDDACKQPAPPVDWSCANSAYNGQQYWTCSGGDIYKCAGGVPQKQDCDSGCNVNPVGTDDTCKSASPPPVNWNCANSAYNGQQYWTCSGGNIYKCSGGVPEEQVCNNGCKSNPLGTNDVCL